MICLAWNVHGLGNEQTQNALSHLCSSHKMDWLAILEPRIMSSSLPRRYLSGLKLRIFAENNDLDCVLIYGSFVEQIWWLIHKLLLPVINLWLFALGYYFGVCPHQKFVHFSTCFVV